MHLADHLVFVIDDTLQLLYRSVLFVVVRTLHLEVALGVLQHTTELHDLLFLLVHPALQLVNLLGRHSCLGSLGLQTAIKLTLGLLIVLH